tara:strand:- start:367 stop:681 length:315 start_codon:yes stop_codon:yes gene_type:complete
MKYTNIHTEEVANFGGTPDDNWIKSTEEDIGAQELKDAKIDKIAVCRTYLISSDWQLMRESETSEAMKAGVSDNRIFARESQGIIEAYTDIVEVEAYDITQLTN